MTRNEFIKWLKKELKLNAQMDFLLVDYDNLLGRQSPTIAFLDIHDICMNVDVDDPDNKNRGGIVFEVKKDLSKDLNEFIANKKTIQKIIDTIDQELNESPGYEYRCKDGSRIATDVGYVEDWWQEYKHKLEHMMR